LNAIQEAWKLIESTVIPNQQAFTSLALGGILFSADRDTEAWKYIEIALMKASHIGNQLVIAQALEYMGYGYLRRGDYKNAYGAYVLSGAEISVRRTWPGSNRNRGMLMQSLAFTGMALTLMNLFYILLFKGLRVMFPFPDLS